jgi:hypothetical protein
MVTPDSYLQEGRSYVKQWIHSSESRWSAPYPYLFTCNRPQSQVSNVPGAGRCRRAWKSLLFWVIGLPQPYSGFIRIRKDTISHSFVRRIRCFTIGKLQLPGPDVISVLGCHLPKGSRQPTRALLLVAT